MFCTKCGQQIPDDAKFCEFCGEKFGESAGAPKENPVNTLKKGVDNLMSEKKDNKQLIIIGVVAAVALIAVIIIFSLLFGSSPKKAVKNYYKDRLKAMNGEYTSDSFWGCNKAESKLKLEEVEYKLKDFKIKKVTKYSKDDDEFENVVDYVDDEMDGEGKKIKGVAVVKVKGKILTFIDGDEEDDEERKIEDELVVVKIGGKWYVTDLDKDDISKEKDKDKDED